MLRFSIGFASLLLLTTAVSAQSLPKPVRKGTKYRIKVDSAPQQAAIYVDKREYGIEGYTPTTLKLPRGTYNFIVELPGFQTVERTITVRGAANYLFTMERKARPAVVDVRAPSSPDAAGAQLFVDGAVMGTVPARIEVQPGSHLIEAKKAGFKDFRETVTLNEGQERVLVADLQAEQKKGSMLVVADVSGAEVYVDGQRHDAAPTLVTGLTEGMHVVEVRKGDLPAWKQTVQVIGNQQTKVEAKLAEKMVGSLRIVSSTTGAEVYVDGEMKGTVNSEIGNIRPGQHIVEVRARDHASQTIELTVQAGEQRVAKMDLKQQTAAQGVGHVRVVSAVPEAEVYLDGASVGKAPFDRADVPTGKHFVIVRKSGYADWKREITVDAGAMVALTAELSASGGLKVLANVSDAAVYIDGQMMGKTPLTLEAVAAGEHMVEVKHSGYADAKLSVRIEGGQPKVLAAELVEQQTGPSAQEVTKSRRAMTSYSAVTIDPARFTADLSAGYVPFFQGRLTVGAWRRKGLGLDIGIGIRTTGYFTEGGVHSKFQFLRAGPVAMGTEIYIGGGGGPLKRNNVTFEAGIPFSLLFGEVVRFTLHPYVQVYSDRNCPAVSDIQDEVRRSAQMTVAGSASYQSEERACKTYDTAGTRMGDPVLNDGTLTLEEMSKFNVGQDPRDRFTNVRLMLRAGLEIAVHQIATIFFIFEADPIGKRRSLEKKFSSIFPEIDYQVYGRAGVTFKF